MLEQVDFLLVLAISREIGCRAFFEVEGSALVGISIVFEKVPWGKAHIQFLLVCASGLSLTLCLCGIWISSWRSLLGFGNTKPSWRMVQSSVYGKIDRLVILMIVRNERDSKENVLQEKTVEVSKGNACWKSVGIGRTNGSLSGQW